MNLLKANIEQLYSLHEEQNLDFLCDADSKTITIIEKEEE